MSVIKNIPFVDLYVQYNTIKGQIDEAISEVIKMSEFIRGNSVDQFEKNFSKLIGTEYCVSCGNGTDALFIAIKGLGIKPGDEVITTAHSWISTSETITQAGGKVVFCDTDKDSFTIDTSLIPNKINKNTVGIIPVHLYGHPAQMDEICKIAKNYNLWIIEDCAQAHLAEFNNTKVGTFGDASTFSFYPGKNLGAMGDAGCINTNDKKLSDWATLFARHGGKGTHLIEGINSRLDGIQAAILNVKMKYLEGWNQKRISIAKIYNQMLRDIEQIKCPSVKVNCKHVYHLYVIKTSQRDPLKTFLEKNGVMTSINYPKALPFLPAYSNFGHTENDFPVAFSNQEQILSLPIYPEMKEEDVLYVCENIKKFFNK